MLKESFHHPLANDRSTYPELINTLEKHFNNWKFTYMGGLSRLKESVHYHIRSDNSNEKGIVEITLSPQLNGKVEVKVADNRLKDWSKSAFGQLVQFLNQSN